METQNLVASVCVKWWRSNLVGDDGPARMKRARLRRCTVPLEALLIDSVHDLGHGLQMAGYNKFNADGLALVAIGISYIQQSDENAKKLAEEFGRKESKDGPRVFSEQRFQNLIRTTDKGELIAPLRRGLAIVRKRPINVASLAKDLFYWDDKTRISWCFQYFGASALYEPEFKEIKN